MSELADVIGGNTITAAFTNDVKERSLMRYATAAARDSSIPAPIAGSLAWLQDVDEITVYDGAVWRTVGLADLFLPLAGGTMSGVINMQPNVFSTSRADTNLSASAGQFQTVQTLAVPNGTYFVICSGFHSASIAVNVEYTDAIAINETGTSVQEIKVKLLGESATTTAHRANGTVGSIVTVTAGNIFYRVERNDTDGTQQFLQARISALSVF